RSNIASEPRDDDAAERRRDASLEADLGFSRRHGHGVSTSILREVKVPDAAAAAPEYLPPRRTSPDGQLPHRQLQRRKLQLPGRSLRGTGRFGWRSPLAGQLRPQGEVALRADGH